MAAHTHTDTVTHTEPDSVSDSASSGQAVAGEEESLPYSLGSYFFSFQKLVGLKGTHCAAAAAAAVPGRGHQGAQEKWPHPFRTAHKVGAH